jgi:hypothetical protein
LSIPVLLALSALPSATLHHHQCYHSVQAEAAVVEPLPTLEGTLKIVGIGPRGISASNRLIGKLQWQQHWAAQQP